MRRTIAVSIVLATSMVGVIAPASSAGATAGPVVCGATITADTTLHHDLVNCPDNGLVIAADNITVNLNGHTIDGDDAAMDPCPGVCDVGVANTAGHSGVVITNGSVTGFATGVLVIGADANRLRHLSLTRNLGSGAIVADSDGTRVQGNLISQNGLTTDQAGMDLFDSHATLIQGNTISKNGDIGLFAAPAGDSNRILDNVIADNPEAGISLDGTSNAISENQLRRNGDGIDFSGDGNLVTRNLVTDSLGCPDGCGFGISFEGGSNNQIADNVVARTHGAGIRVDAYAGATTGTVIRANVVRAARSDGIVVDQDQVGPVTGTLLTGNVALGAGHDGINVKSPSTTLVRNCAGNNAALGIEAVRGVTDGGGNHAHDNGNPHQCTHVSC